MSTIHIPAVVVNPRTDKSSNITFSAEDAQSSDDETKEMASAHVVALAKISDSTMKFSQIDWDRFGDVHKLHDEIRVLTAALAARDAECDSMSEAVLTLKDELAVIQAQGVPQAAKEVARRNKHLSLQLERERVENRRLAEALQALQITAGQPIVDGSLRKNEESSLDDGDEEESAESLRQQLQDFQVKYNLANRRMLDARANLTLARADTSRLARLLQREVGDDVSIQDLALLDEGKTRGASSSAPNWVGRAQKISILSAKLKEVRAAFLQLQQSQSTPPQIPAEALQRLREISHRVSSTPVIEQYPWLAALPSLVSSLGSLNESAFSPSTMPLALPSVASDKHRSRIETLERDRRQEHEHLAASYEAAIADLAASRSKLDALTARNKTLESDYHGLRSRVRTVLDKTEGDDRLIDSLRVELGRIQGATARHLQAAKAASEEASVQKNKARQAENESAAVSSRLQQALAEISDQTRIITSLRLELNHALEITRAQKRDDALWRFDCVESDFRLKAAQSELQESKALVDLLRRRLGDSELKESRPSKARLPALSSAVSAKPPSRTGGDALRLQLSTAEDELNVYKEVIAKERALATAAIDDLKAQIECIRTTARAGREE